MRTLKIIQQHKKECCSGWKSVNGCIKMVQIIYQGSSMIHLQRAVIIENHKNCPQAEQEVNNMNTGERKINKNKMT